MRDRNEGSERQSFMIKVIIITILLLLSFLATILYVFTYPRTTVLLYDDHGKYWSQFTVRRHSKLDNLPSRDIYGYEFLYWTQDLENPIAFDPDSITMEEEEFRLYAQYRANKFTVIYNVQVWDPVERVYKWQPCDEIGQVTEDYLTDIKIHNGRIKNIDGSSSDEFISILEKRVGATFAGWTLDKGIAEGALDENKDKLYRVTQEDDCIIPLEGNMNLYAYYEKDQYTVNLNSGIKYFYENGSPIDNPTMLDSSTKLLKTNGEFVIHNDRIASDSKLVKYQDPISSVTEKIVVEDYCLNEIDEGIGFAEYDFKGWFFDQEYQYRADNYSTKIDIWDIDENGIDIPIINLYDENGDLLKEFFAVYDEEDGRYEFNLYSKWERRSYEISFNKNSNPAQYTPTSVSLFKVDIEYGKFYNCTYDLTEATNAQYQTGAGVKYFYQCYPSYVFTGWNLTSKATNEEDWYYARKQVDNQIVDWSGSAPTWTAKPNISYSKTTYEHTVSEDVVFYAQWKPLQILEFRMLSRGGNVIQIECVAGDTFDLPGKAIICDQLGWTKEHYRFIGWAEGTSSDAPAKLEANKDLGEFTKTILASTTPRTICLYVKWEAIVYTITFDANKGKFSDDTTKKFIYKEGNKTISRSQAPVPVREGYLFEGWSTNQYPDNTPNSIKENFYPAANFSLNVVKDMYFYATWTLDYVVQFNANGGSGGLPATVRYSSSSQAKDSKLTLYVGGSSLSRAYNNFTGWAFTLGETTIKSAYITIDFSGEGDVKKWSFGQTFDEANAYTFKVSGDLKNIATLYACWEPKVYDIKIHKNTGNFITLKLPYGTSVNLAEYTNFDSNGDGKIDENDTQTVKEWASVRNAGEQFIGWATANSTDEKYRLSGDTLIGTEITQNKTYYAIYQKVSIIVKFFMFKYNDDTLLETEKSKTIGYNTSIGVLPVKSAESFGNTAYEFGYWYYIEDNGTEAVDDDYEVIVKSGDIVTKYVMEDGVAVLKLYAKFIKQAYTVKFNMVNPHTGIVEETLQFEVEKGDKAKPNETEIENGAVDIYSLVEDACTKYAANIKEFTLLNMLYVSALNSVVFSESTEFNSTYFPSAAAGADIVFNTNWQANTVVIRYWYEGESRNANTSLDYAFRGELKLLSADTDLGFVVAEDKKVTAWEVLALSDGSYRGLGDAYKFGVGDNLISQNQSYSIYSSFKFFKDYIVWEGDIGYLNLGAITNDVYTIEYYKWNGLTEELITTERFEYFGNQPEVVIKGANDVVGKTGLKFLCWKVGSMDSNVSVSNTITLSNNTFPDYKIKLYADITFEVRFIADGINFDATDLGSTYSLKSNTLIKTISLYNKGDAECEYDENGYFVKWQISQIPYFARVEEGFVGYVVKYNGNIYDLSTNQIKIEFTNTNHEINVLGTSEISIQFTVKSNETILVDSIEQPEKTYTKKYLIDINAEPVYPIIAEITAARTGCRFIGWALSADETDETKIYSSEAVLPFTEDVVLYAIFSAPKGETILATIYLVYGRDAEGNPVSEPWEDSQYNGLYYNLPANKASVGKYGWTKANSEIVGWTLVSHGGATYAAGESFYIDIEIEKDTKYYFDAVWEELYTVSYGSTFNTAINIPTTTKNLLPEDIFDVENGVKPSLTDTEGTKFKNWILGYYVLDSETMARTFYPLTLKYDASGKAIPLTLNPGDSFRFVKESINGVVIDVNGGKYLYTVPRVMYSGNVIYDYVLLADWTKETFEVEVNVATNPLRLSNPSDDEILNYTITVEYGDSLTVADIINYDTTNTIKDLIESMNFMDLKGFSLSGFNGQLADASVLKNINRNGIVLYSVWSQKYKLSYAEATADADFDYKTALADEYYFAGDKLNFTPSIVKSIYKKGYNTIYFDNGSYVVVFENNGAAQYYRLIGFQVEWNGGFEFVSISGSTFVVPGEDGMGSMVATPVFEQIFRVNIVENVYRNAAYSSTILYTFYVQENTEINLNTGLSSYIKNYQTPTTPRFDFVGYANAYDSKTKLTYITITANQNLYCIWQSNIKATFNYGVNTLFTIMLNDQGKIDLTTLNSFLKDSSGSSTNGFRYLGLEGNEYTFAYDNYNLYVYKFVANSTNYLTMQALSNAAFDGSVNVSIVAYEIYTLAYSAGEGQEISGEYSNTSYIVRVVNGTSYEYKTLTSTGLADGVELVDADAIAGITNGNKQATGWQFENYVWKFATKIGGKLLIPQEDLYKIIDDSSVLAGKNYTIDLVIFWEGMSYTLKIKYAQDPLSAYSSITELTPEVIESDDHKNKWYSAHNNVYLYENGSLTILQVTEGDVSIREGNRLVFSAPSVSGFKLLGWSLTPVRLGEIPNSYMNVSADLSSNILIWNIDDTFVSAANADNVIYLYPVYQATSSLSYNVIITPTNGNAIYSVSLGVPGFVYEDPSIAVEETITNRKAVSLNALYDITISYDTPNDFFEFSHYIVNGEVNAESSIVIEKVNKEYNVEVVYDYCEYTLDITLNYEYELLSGVTDLSTLTIAQNTLGNGVLSANTTIQYNTQLSLTDINLSEYFSTVSVVLTNGEQVQVVSNPTSYFVVMQSLLEVDDTIEMIITLSPSFYSVTFDLQGGILENPTLSATHSIYNVAEIPVVDNVALVVKGAEITLPTVVREDWQFRNWKCSDSDYVEGDTTYIVDQDASFIAVFVGNVYTITYIVGSQSKVVKFEGGTNVLIGYDQRNETWVSTELDGYNFLNKWTGNDSVEYTHNKTYTMADKNYVLTASLDGKFVNVVYQNSPNNESQSISNAHKYGESFETLDISASNGSWTLPEHQYIYAWTTPNGNQVLAGEIVDDWSQIVDNFSDLVILTPVYYNYYTFSMSYNFDETKSSTANYVETYIIKAIDEDGNIEISSLEYVLRRDIPTGLEDLASDNGSTWKFAGYKIKVDGEYKTNGEGDLVLFNNEILELEYIIGTYSYTYFIEAQWSRSSTSAIFTTYITDPTDANNVLTIDGSDHIDVIIIDVGGTYNVSQFMPFNNGNNWTYSSLDGFDGVEYLEYTFETEIVNPYQYSLVGYNLYYIETEGAEETFFGFITFESKSRINNIYHSYILRAVWESKYQINYFDVDGDLIESIYVDAGSESQIHPYSYDLDGYELLGFVNVSGSAPLANQIPDLLASKTPGDSTNYYYNFGESITVTSSLNLYPAFSRIYTLKFHNQDEYGIADFNLEEIELYNSRNSKTYITDVMNNIVKYGDGTYKIDAKDGYVFVGLSLDASDRDNTITNYILNTLDADSGFVINVYAVWGREERILTITANAINAKGQSVITNTTNAYYQFNTVVDILNDATIQAFKAQVDETLGINYQFVDYKINKESVTSYKLIANTQLVLNYVGVYKVKYQGIEEEIMLGIASEITEDLLVENKPIAQADETKVYCWSADGKTDLFKGNNSVKALDILKYVDENYTINLSVIESDKTYSYNLYFVKEDGAEVSSEIFASATGFAKGDKLISIGNGGFTAPKFDAFINETLGINNGLMGLYSTAGYYNTADYGYYSWNGKIKVHNRTVNISEYVVGNLLDLNGDPYWESDIYLVYESTEFEVTIAGAVINDSQDNSIRNIVYSDFTYYLNDNENPNIIIYSAKLRNTDKMQLITPDSEAVEEYKNNLSGKKFIGYKPVKVITSGSNYVYEILEWNNSYINSYGDFSATSTTVIVENLKKSITENTGLIICPIYEEVYSNVVIEITNSANDLAAQTIVPDIMAYYMGDKIGYIGTQELKKVVDGVSPYTLILVKDYVRVDNQITFKVLGEVSLEFINDYDSYSIKTLTINNQEPIVFESQTSESVYIVEDTSIVLDFAKKLFTVYFSTYQDLAPTIILNGSYITPNYTYDEDFNLGKTFTIYGEDSSTSCVFIYEYSQIPYATSINTSIFSLNMSYYSFNGWKVYSLDGRLLDGVTQITQDCLFVADASCFTPKKVVVEFYDATENVLISTMTKDSENQDLVYGSQIILPSYYLDDGKTLSYAWSEGEFNTEITLNKTSLLIWDTTSERYTYRITARVFEYYYILFNAGDCGFDITGFPTTKSTNHRVADLRAFVTDSNPNPTFTVSAGTVYNIDLSAKTYSTSTTTGYKISSYYEIKEENIQDKGNFVFTNWQTISGRVFNNFNRNYVYSADDVTMGDNTIVFTARGGELYTITVNFVAPTGETGLHMFAVDKSKIQETGELYYLKYELVGKVVTIGLYRGLTERLDYFTIQLNEDTDLSNYVMLGYGQQGYVCFTSDELFDNYDGTDGADLKDTGILYYSYENVGALGIQRNELPKYVTDGSTNSFGYAFSTHLKNAKNLNLYTIWEEKQLVKFSATIANDGANYSKEDYYALGDKVYVPNYETVKLEKTGFAWTGWQAGENEYLFENMPQEMVTDDGEPYVSLYMYSQGTMNLTPYWDKNAVKLMLNINFENEAGIATDKNWLEYYVSAVSKYISTQGIKEEDIKAGTNYPQIKPAVINNIIGEKTSHNGKYSQYRITNINGGNIFSIDDKVSLDNFFDNSIYNHTYYVEGTNLSANTQYFYVNDIFGVDADGKKVSVQKIINDTKSREILLNNFYTINSVINLYIEWKPVELEIRFNYNGLSLQYKDGEFDKQTVAFGENYEIPEYYLDKDIIEEKVFFENKDYYQLDNWYANADWWKDSFVGDLQEGRLPLIYDTELNPAFTSLYKVVYVSGDSSSSELNVGSSFDYQYVALGKSVKLNDIKAIYGNYLRENNAFKFNENTFGRDAVEIEIPASASGVADIVGNDNTLPRSIIIHVYCAISISQYMPDTYAKSDPDYQKIKAVSNLNIGSTYSMLDLGLIVNPTLTNYNGSSFEGWYISNKKTASDYYNSLDAYNFNSVLDKKLSDSDIYTDYSVKIADAKGYSSTITFVLEVNDTAGSIKTMLYAIVGGYTLKLESSLINLYAKLLTKTTINIPVVPEQINYIYEKDYIQIDTANSTVQNIVYKSVYGSPKGITISITNAPGYATSKVDNADGLLIVDTNNNYKELKDTNIVTRKLSNNATLVLERTFENAETVKAVEELTIAGNIKSGKTFVVYTSSLSYDISYKMYNDVFAKGDNLGDISFLYYRITVGGADRYDAFVNYIMPQENAEAGDPMVGKITISKPVDLVVYKDSLELEDNITLDFELIQDQDAEGNAYGIVKILNVPYGMVLETRVIPDASYNMYHLNGWNATPASVGYIDIETQTILPTGMSANDHIREYQLTAGFGINELNATVYASYASTTSDWTRKLDSLAKTGQVSKTSTNGVNTYTLDITGFLCEIDEYTLTINAGDISSEIADIINAYQKEYHTSFAMGEEGEETVASVLARFFLMSSAEKWLIEGEDATNNIKYDSTNLYLYGNHNSNISIYCSLDPATFTNVKQVVVDYNNPNEIISNVNRASIENIAVQYNPAKYDDEGNLIFDPQEYKYVLDKDNKYSIANKFEFKGDTYAYIKTPYTNSDEVLNIDMKPADNYYINKWIVNDIQTECVDPQGVSLDRMEINATAYLIINKFKISFYNSNGVGLSVDQIEIAYDEGIYNLDPNKYSHYGYSLTTLRDKGLIPLFVLDANVSVLPDYQYMIDYGSNSCVFAYPQDSIIDDGVVNVKLGYGMYQKIFESWTVDGNVYNVNTPISSALSFVAKYSDDLPTAKIAYYEANGFVNSPNLLDIDIYSYTETTYDCFGNEYTNYIKNILNECYIESESDYLLLRDFIAKVSMAPELDDKGNAYIYTITGENVETMQVGETFFAKFIYKIETYNSYRETEPKNITIISYGGLITFSTTVNSFGNSTIKFNNEGATTNVNGNTNGYQFALWNMSASGKDDSYSINYCGQSTCPDCNGLVFIGESVIVVRAVYNSMIKFTTSSMTGYADISLTDASGKNVATGTTLSLVNSTPSNVAMSDSGVHYALRIIRFTKEDKGYAIKIIDPLNIITMYTLLLDFTNYTDYDVVCNIKYLTYSVQLQLGSNLRIEDGWGPIDISVQPILQVTPEFQGLVITNAPNFNSVVNISNIYSKYNGGFNSLYVGDLLSYSFNLEHSQKLLICNSGSSSVAYGYSNTYDKFYNANTNPKGIFNYITNIRLQYFINNTWVDASAGSTDIFVVDSGNKKFNFRIACDWIEYEYTFETIDSVVANNDLSTYFTKDYTKVFFTNENGEKIDVTSVIGFASQLGSSFDIATFSYSTLTESNRGNKVTIKMHKGASVESTTFAINYNTVPSVRLNDFDFSAVQADNLYERSYMAYVNIPIDLSYFWLSFEKFDAEGNFIGCHYVAVPNQENTDFIFGLYDKYIGSGQVELTITNLEDRMFGRDGETMTIDIVKGAPVSVQAPADSKIAINVLDNANGHIYHGMQINNASSLVNTRNYNILPENNVRFVNFAFDRSSLEKELIIVKYNSGAKEYEVISREYKVYAEGNFKLTLNSDRNNFGLEYFDGYKTYNSNYQLTTNYALLGEEFNYKFVDKAFNGDVIQIPEEQEVGNFNDTIDIVSGNLIIILTETLSQANISYQYFVKPKTSKQFAQVQDFKNYMNFYSKDLSKIVTPAESFTNISGLSLILRADKLSGGIFFGNDEDYDSASGSWIKSVSKYRLAKVVLNEKVEQLYATLTTDNQDTVLSKSQTTALGKDIIVQIYLEERETAEINFVLSLPYASDYRNLNIKTYTYMGYTPKFNGYNGDIYNWALAPHVPYMEYNDALSKANYINPASVILTIGDTLKLDTAVANGITTYTLKVNGNALFSFELNEVYSYQGVFKRTGGLYNRVNLIEDKGYKYYSYDPELGYSNLLNANNLGSIDTDMQIMVAFLRKKVTIEVDDDIWSNTTADKYYNKLNTNAVFEDKTYRHIHESYGGLAVVIPNVSKRPSSPTKYFYNDSTPKSYDDGSVLDTWLGDQYVGVYTSGLSISLEDSDPFVRLYTALNRATDIGTTILPMNSGVAGAASIYDATKIVGYNSKGNETSASIGYNAELLGSTRWKLINLPYGDTNYNTAKFINIKVFDREYGNAQAKEWDFSQGSAKGDNYLPMSLSGISLPRVTSGIISTGALWPNGDYGFTVSGKIANRLYQGITFEDYDDALNRLDGFVSGNKIKDFWNREFSFYYSGAIDTEAKYRIDGYTLILTDASGKTQKYTLDSTSELYESSQNVWLLNILLNSAGSSYRTMDIYPIITKVENVSITYSQDIIYKGNTPTLTNNNTFAGLNASVDYGASYSAKITLEQRHYQESTHTTTKSKPVYTVRQNFTNYGDCYLMGFNLKYKGQTSVFKSVPIFTVSDNGLSITQPSALKSTGEKIIFTLSGSDLTTDIIVEPIWVAVGGTINYTHRIGANGPLFEITAKTHEGTKDGNVIKIKPEYLKTVTFDNGPGGNYVLTSNLLSNMKYNAVRAVSNGDLVDANNNGVLDYTMYDSYSLKINNSELSKRYFRIYSYTIGQNPNSSYLYLSPSASSKDRVFNFIVEHDSHNFSIVYYKNGIKISECKYCTGIKEEECDHKWSKETYSFCGNTYERKHTVTKTCTICGFDDTTTQACTMMSMRRPTCTERGGEQCEKCFENFFINPLGHLPYYLHKNGSKASNPKVKQEDCDRIQIHWSSQPGNVPEWMKGTTINSWDQVVALSFENWVYGVGNGQTCENGTYTRCCYCFEKYSLTGSHNFSKNYYAISKEPTCQTGGTAYRICLNCNKRENTPTIQLPLIDHKMQTTTGKVKVWNPDPTHCYAFFPYTITGCTMCDYVTNYAITGKSSSSTYHNKNDIGICTGCKKYLRNPSGDEEGEYDKAWETDWSNIQTSDLFLYRDLYSHRDEYHEEYLRLMKRSQGNFVVATDVVLQTELRDHWFAKAYTAYTKNDSWWESAVVVEASQLNNSNSWDYTGYVVLYRTQIFYGNNDDKEIKCSGDVIRLEEIKIYYDGARVSTWKQGSDRLGSGAFGATNTDFASGGHWIYKGLDVYKLTFTLTLLEDSELPDETHRPEGESYDP